MQLQASQGHPQHTLLLHQIGRHIAAVGRQVLQSGATVGASAATGTTLSPSPKPSSGHPSHGRSVCQALNACSDVMAGWMNCIIQNEHLNSTMVDTNMDFLEMDFRGTSAATFTR
jgi:hypothetical protein